MLQSSFKQSYTDYSLFYKGQGSNYVALFVYVNDILITSSSTTKIEAIKNELRNKFKLKDVSSLGYFLGLEITRSK